jgi:hypothetical protein
MQKLNFLVENMGATQLSYVITQQLNHLSSIDRNIDGVVFYNTMHKHAMMPNFAIMQMIEAWSQQGTTIATSLATASQLIGYPGPNQKIYYVWDLPWMRINPKIYGITQEIITNPNLLLLTRSESYADAISIAYNVERPVVVENLDIVKLLEVIKNG